MVKIGDRVRFLNAVGGGTVSRFIKKDVVGVLDDDGFEIPILEKECVVIENVNTLNFPASPSAKSPEPIATPILQKNIENQPEEEWMDEEETNYGDAISLYLGFVPSNIKTLSNTSFDLFLINDSNYSLGYLYAIANHKQEHLHKDNGVMYPNTKLFLETLEREDLNKIRQLIIQAVAFKKSGAYQPKPTLDFSVKLTIADFNKLHSFTENDFFETNALIIPLMEKDLPAAFIHPAPEQIREAMLNKELPEPIRLSKKEKPNEKGKTVVEIDLHINQLLDSTAGMDNATMLNYQMDKFREIVEKYKNNKGQKIVFIHGKGEGVLRKEIVKELKIKHPDFYFQDASFREYGFGATMVTIR